MVGSYVESPAQGNTKTVKIDLQRIPLSQLTLDLLYVCACALASWCVAACVMYNLAQSCTCMRG